MERNYTRLYIIKEKKMIQRKIAKKNARKRKGAKREKKAEKRKKGEK